MKCLTKIIQTLINKVMKKGTAMEGFIREDGTVRPIEHYDDTELRGKIQTNTDNISNLDSRVAELEEHGGVEDPTKADKVENATAGNLASLDENGNLQDSGLSAEHVGEEIHSLSYKDGSYESRMGVGKLNRDDDELDGVGIYGKDAIRIVTAGGRVFIDSTNIENLRCALLGLEISFVRDENGNYAIDSELKESLNGLIDKMPADKCVPCVVIARWWNGGSYVSGHFPGSLCRHDFVGPKIYHTIYLSFLGNLFYTQKTNTSDFPDTWTKFENPFASTSSGNMVFDGEGGGKDDPETGGNNDE